MGRGAWDAAVSALSGCAVHCSAGGVTGRLPVPGSPGQPHRGTPRRPPDRPGGRRSPTSSAGDRSPSRVRPRTAAARGRSWRERTERGVPGVGVPGVQWPGVGVAVRCRRAVACESFVGIGVREAELLQCGRVGGQSAGQGAVCLDQVLCGLCHCLASSPEVMDGSPGGCGSAGRCRGRCRCRWRVSSPSGAGSRGCRAGRRPGRRRRTSSRRWRVCGRRWPRRVRRECVRGRACPTRRRRRR